MVHREGPFKKGKLSIEANLSFHLDFHCTLTSTHIGNFKVPSLGPMYALMEQHLQQY